MVARYLGWWHALSLHYPLDFASGAPQFLQPVQRLVLIRCFKALWGRSIHLVVRCALRALSSTLFGVLLYFTCLPRGSGCGKCCYRLYLLLMISFGSMPSLGRAGDLHFAIGRWCPLSDHAWHRNDDMSRPSLLR